MGAIPAIMLLVKLSILYNHLAECIRMHSLRPEGLEAFSQRDPNFNSGPLV